MSFHNELNALFKNEMGRLAGRNSETIDKQAAMLFELRKANKELEAENARLRQERDAANALIAVLMDEDAKTE